MLCQSWNFYTQRTEALRSSYISLGRLKGLCSQGRIFTFPPSLYCLLEFLTNFFVGGGGGGGGGGDFCTGSNQFIFKKKGTTVFSIR